MSNIFQVGVSWLTSWFNGSTLKDASSQEKQELVAKGLIEKSSKQIILHDLPAGKYICFTGPDKEKKLAAYLETNLQMNSEEVLGQTDKVMMVAIGAIFTASQLIAPIMFIAERLNLDKFRLPDLSCKTGVLASSLCFVTPKSKGLCIGLSVLSVLKPVFASIAVIKAIPDQKAYPNQNFTLPLRVSDIFQESDPSLSMSVSAKQSNGEPLPTWLKFNITPFLTGSIATSNAQNVYVVSNIAYVADWTSGLKIIDVSNPHAPFLVASFITSYASSVYVVSNIAYVAAASAGLKLIDVSKPSAPSLVGSIVTYCAYAVSVLSNIAYVADFTAGLKLIDVSNPSAPSLVGSIATRADRVYVVSNIAYVADDNSGLKLIDVSNPRSPLLVGSIANDNADGVYVVSNIAYVTCAGEGFKLIDVSNPYAPLLLGSIATSAAYGVCVVSNIAYVTDWYSLKLIDVSNPQAPSLVGLIGTDGYAEGVYVVSNIAYVADWTKGLKLIDIYSATFTGSPTCADSWVKYNITLQVQNNLGETASTYFNLQVYNEGPRLAYPIANQTIHVGHAFKFPVPSNTFIDKCNDDLTYSSKLTDGHPLPDWLTFNPTNQQFIGTPLAKEDIKAWDIEVKATDPYDKSAETSFSLNALHLGPHVAHSINNQTLEAGHPFFLQVSASTFDNLDDVPLTYSSMLVNRKSLPSWLTFSSNLQQFNGTTQSKKDLGNLGIVVKAADAYGKSAETSFHLDIYNQGIIVTGTIPDQQVFANVYFEYIFPSVFLDEDNLSLSYRALLLNGNPLPLWLNLDSDSRTFSGTASDLDIGIHQIRLYGGDNYAEKSVDFEMIVYPFHYQSPVVKNGIPSKEASVGKYFSYKIPDDAFTSPTSDHLTYNAFLTGGNALPSWLSFAPDSKTFSGSPNGEGTLSITVTVTDSYEASAQTSFTLTSVNRTLQILKTFANIGGPIISVFGFLITAYVNRAAIRNHFKKKDYQVPDETITIGKPWYHTIKKVDAYHIKAIKVLVQYTAENLSFSERVSNWWNDSFVELPAQKSIPDWLTYDESNNELKNDPSKMATQHGGTYKVMVLNKSGYTMEEFLLHVQKDGAPVLPTIVPPINSSSRDIEMGTSMTMTEPLLRVGE